MLYRSNSSEKLRRIEPYYGHSGQKLTSIIGTKFQTDTDENRS